MNILNIDVKNVKKEIKKTKKYLKYCDKNNYKIKYLNTNDFFLKNIEKAINIKDINKRYSFIYDIVCDYIDDKYLNCNYCDFKDDVCIFFRSQNKMDHKNGCCYSDARGGLCEHLKDKHCQIKSISCKLYSCPILRDNKIYFKLKDIPLIKYFFNIKQKYIIKYSFFKDKTYVLYKLIEKK